VNFGARSANSLQFLAAYRRDRKLTRPARSAELRRGRPGYFYRGVCDDLQPIPRSRPVLWSSHDFRQLGDGSRYSPRFIAAKELHDQPASGVVFVIDVGQFLTASRFDDKAARQILH